PTDVPPQLFQAQSLSKPSPKSLSGFALDPSKLVVSFQHFDRFGSPEKLCQCVSVTMRIGLRCSKRLQAHRPIHITRQYHSAPRGNLLKDASQMLDSDHHGDFIKNGTIVSKLTGKTTKRVDPAFYLVSIE